MDQDFTNIAPSLPITIEDKFYRLKPTKYFSDGKSLYGWEHTGKQDVIIGGEAVEVDFQVSVTVKPKKVDTHQILSESEKEEKTKEKEEETKDSHNSSMERILKQKLDQERTFKTAVRGERKKINEKRFKKQVKREGARKIEKSIG